MDGVTHHIRWMIRAEIHTSRLHLSNLAVHPENRNRITCEIRETNLSGQLFLRSQGLRAVSVLRDYYDDITEDAYVMLYRVNSNQGAIL